MVSVDTSILFHAFLDGSALQASAREFLSLHAEDPQFVICEAVLEEFCGLVCNPAVVERPLSPERADAICVGIRGNTHWEMIEDPSAIAYEFWVWAASPKLRFKRVYEARVALTLRYRGVTEFATQTPANFKHFGFKRVWDPLET
jgi:predicted nucleic acid-binding protein